ncbi:unnamed protein product [Spirodela intermedia]|uniref:Uncharacterized protein n=2 Tax=Spirodela intermedia TaxID=51605 RepID=A0A7I8KN79_SPIIN|nr:unnamed protein product [Spirodela intermedia]CAA6662142.1 unnamed protein product [Spirodela intermedia]CAA7398524.1 unnamed protein product [Spirodela intermedia]
MEKSMRNGWFLCETCGRLDCSLQLEGLDICISFIDDVFYASDTDAHQAAGAKGSLSKEPQLEAQDPQIKDECPPNSNSPDSQTDPSTRDILEVVFSSESSSTTGAPDDVERAGGFGARDDIGSFLPVAMDSTDFEASLRDAREFEGPQHDVSHPGLGWTEPRKPESGALTSPLPDVFV